MMAWAVNGREVKWLRCAGFHMGKVRDVQSVRYSYLQYFAVSADTSVLFKISLFKNICVLLPLGSKVCMLI